MHLILNWSTIQVELTKLEFGAHTPGEMATTFVRLGTSKWGLGRDICPIFIEFVRSAYPRLGRFHSH